MRTGSREEEQYLVRKTIWLSLRKIKIHEFQRHIRFMHQNGEQLSIILERLASIQKGTTNLAIKMLITPILFYSTYEAFASNSEVSFIFNETKLQIPSGIASYLASVSFLMFVLCLQTWCMALSIRINETKNLSFGNFSMTAQDQYNDPSSVALATPVLPYSFLKERLPVSWALTTIFWIILLFLLLPVFALAAGLLHVQLEILHAKNLGLIDRISAGLGLLTVGYSIVYLVLFNVPLPVSKNQRHIRWNFLSLISKTFPHPLAADWGKDKRT